MKTLMLALVFLGCGARAPVPVTVVNPIVVKVQHDSLAECWLEDPPEPPDKMELNTGNEDILSRVFVHMLDHNLVVGWTHLMWVWATNMKTCMDKVTDQ